MDTVSNEQLLPANPRKYARPSESNVGSIRMLAVNDHPVLRVELLSIAASERDMCIVGEAANGHEAVAQYVVFRSNVVLLDLTCPR